MGRETARKASLTEVASPKNNGSETAKMIARKSKQSPRTPVLSHPHE
jgi:hypothetical protein